MLCLRSDQSEFMVAFIVFNLWIGPRLFLSLVVIFQQPFPVTTLRLDLFSDAYLKKLLCLWCTVMENSSI